MTEYTNHADAIFQTGAPILGSTHLEARDNLIATCEGDPTAPSVLPNIGANAELGVVGTYAFLSLAGADIIQGTNYPGSSLKYWGYANPTATINTEVVGPLEEGPSPAGTWKAMGHATFSGTGARRHTLFVRVL